ncbi:putative AraC family transcriptional regulator [Gordonia araii NBRC 100433]|uniref:Putative AraC family transcriptional regulator n=1 Tax=Gordonia araii NBRC 100433 TaxID=1073574 RepID=G7H0U7_9ACTN|nr:putative AraC family transcriptional regulator [Gordonia araii NBRC 100433]
MVVVGYDGAELVDIACVTTALGIANRVGASPQYRVSVATPAGADIQCENGLVLRGESAIEAVREADTLVVSGGVGHRGAAADRALVNEVRRLANHSRRVASVCTGATVLAAAGLLDGRRATTHWLYAAELAADYPNVIVDPSPIFIRESDVATAGGVTASLDLTLAFIEEDHGPEIARYVAMGMVTYLQRPGNQAQMSIFTAAPNPDNLTVRRALNHILTHPGDDLSTAALAAHLGVSTRQLTRLFREHLGEPPAAAVRRIRLELGARLVATTELPFSQIARQCGFASAESFRQAFVARFSTSPRAFRATHSATH